LKVTKHHYSQKTASYASEVDYKKVARQSQHFLKKDYRLLEGQYDKLVSIEMIESGWAKSSYQPFFKNVQFI